jgi:hypothetical protein
MKAIKKKGVKIPSKVIRIYFGDPTLFNVIGYDKESDQYETQMEGKFGSSWIKRDKVIKEVF